MLFLDLAPQGKEQYSHTFSSYNQELDRLSPAERLFYAVDRDDKMLLRHCLEKLKIDVNVRNNDGDSVAHLLSKRTTKLTQMKQIYRLGADFTTKGSFGATPLFLLCETPLAFFEKVETIRWLLSVAPNTLEEPDDDGLTPFLAAVQSGQLKIVRLLLDVGANRLAKTKQGHTAPFLCAMFGHMHLLYYLVMEMGFDVQGEDGCGRTCLHWAAYHGHVQEVAFLRRLGLSPLATDNEGRTPLHWSAFRGHDICVQALCMGNGVGALTMRDNSNKTPIALAAAHGKDSDIFRILSSSKIFGKKSYARIMYLVIVIILALAVSSWVMFLDPTLQVPTPWYIKLYFALGEFMIFYFLWKTCHTDPGSIRVDEDLSTAPMRLAPNEAARFSPLTDTFPVCYTCNTRRVLRSKHSSITNRCIARFDHYCPYVSNDVGLDNQVYFVMFLMFVTLTTVPGLYAFYQRLFVTHFPHEMLAADAGRAHTTLIAFAHQPILFLMFVLDICVSMTVGSLFGNFCVHIITNLTTNESINWIKYKHFLTQNENRFHNPFNRGLSSNVREFFGLERLPSGGYGRLVHWRTCTDIESYKQLRLTLDGRSAQQEMDGGGDSDARVYVGAALNRELERNGFVHDLEDNHQELKDM